MNVWKFKGCSRCGGDLFAQDGEWGCIQCGRYYYPKSDSPFVYPLLFAAASNSADEAKRGRRPRGGLAGRNINAVIRTQHANAERWRAQNQQIIDCLDEGRSVAETATLVGKNLRQVRNVAEKLHDMRALAVG